MNKSEVVQNFATAVNQKIAASGLKKKYIAEQVGITPAMLSGLLKAKHVPNLVTALAIAEILEMSLDDFNQNLK